MPIRKWLSGVLPHCEVFAYAAAVLLGMLAAPLVTVTGAEAKTPGSTYCFVGTCHRVKTLGETHALVGKEELIQASFYDDCSRDRFNPCGLTSSGERFRPNDADNAASPIYPDGTMLLIRNPATEATAVVRVNNAGPYWGKRKLDVSVGAAQKLGFTKSGVAKLEVKVLKAPSASEARYSRNRKYEPVPGYIGRFANADAASANVMTYMALQKMTEGLLAPAAAVILASETGLASEAPVKIAAKQQAPIQMGGNGAIVQLVANAAPAQNDSASAKPVTSRIASRAAKSSRSGKSYKVASKRKASGRRVASARKARAKTRYAAAHRGSRVAKRAYQGKTRYASRRGHRSKNQLAYAAPSRKAASWGNRGNHRGKSKTARKNGWKRYAALNRRNS